MGSPSYNIKQLSSDAIVDAFGGAAQVTVHHGLDAIKSLSGLDALIVTNILGNVSVRY